MFKRYYYVCNQHMLHTYKEKNEITSSNFSLLIFNEYSDCINALKNELENNFNIIDSNTYRMSLMSCIDIPNDIKLKKQELYKYCYDRIYAKHNNIYKEFIKSYKNEKLDEFLISLIEQEILNYYSSIEKIKSFFENTDIKNSDKLQTKYIYALILSILSYISYLNEKNVKISELEKRLKYVASKILLNKFKYEELDLSFSKYKSL